MKRKAEKKAREKEAAAKKKTTEAKGSKTVSVPETALKILSLILSLIMIAALTLYVLGKMPSRGFWVLTALLALIAFVILPVIRRKYTQN